MPLILLVTALWSQYAFSNSCSDLLGRSQAVRAQHNGVDRLNFRLVDPNYKVLVLARHGKAMPRNKFSTEVVRNNPKKARLDKKRPLLKRGKESAMRLSHVLGQLSFQNVGFWGSDAKRVKSTAKPTKKMLGNRLVFKSFEKDLYYADVPTEMHTRLTSDTGESISHAFFWGHGDTTVQLVKELTGANFGFLPTGGVMIIAVKADTWEQAFQAAHGDTEIYTWSPNGTHYIQSLDTKPIEKFELVHDSE